MVEEPESRKVSEPISSGSNLNPVVGSSSTLETILKMEPTNDLINAEILENEMEKRKKRIEYWRQQRKQQQPTAEQPDETEPKGILI